MSAFILNLGEVREDTLGTKYLAVEREASLVDEFHDAYGGDKFRCRGHAVDISHVGFALHLLVGPTEAFAVDQLLVAHNGKRSAFDGVARHPALNVLLHASGCG